MADTQRPRLTRLLGQLNNLIVAQQSLCLQWRGWECHLFGWMKIKRNMEALFCMARTCQDHHACYRLHSIYGCS